MKYDLNHFLGNKKNQATFNINVSITQQIRENPGDKLKPTIVQYENSNCFHYYYFTSSCTAKYFNYNIRMTHPVISNGLEYENDTFYISFDITSKTINFTILNKIEDGIKINWDEVSFSINGKAQRAVHKETGVYKISDMQPPTTIPPKSTLKDFLIPTTNIKYTNFANRTYTIIGEILPKQEFGKKNQNAVIKKYKGTKITVFMPFYIGGKYLTRYYDFTIDDITLSKNAPDKKQ